MTYRTLTHTLIATVFMLSAGATAAASIGEFKDWAAHAEGDGAQKVCWIYSKPTKDEGKYTARGEIYALVTHRPGEKVTNQVQFTAGYTFKKGSEVTVAIGKSKFELFTSGDTAWARSAKDDRAIVAAMRRGASMTVTGTSSRGTATRDTYSLSGISAAHAAIGKACNVK
jgi:hypothetical protein